MDLVQGSAAPLSLGFTLSQLDSRPESYQRRAQLMRGCFNEGLGVPFLSRESLEQVVQDDTFRKAVNVPVVMTTPNAGICGYTLLHSRKC